MMKLSDADMLLIMMLYINMHDVSGTNYFIFSTVMTVDNLADSLLTRRLVKEKI